MSQEEIDETYGSESRLAPKMSGNLPDVVAKLFKFVTGKRVFVPGKFRSKNDDKGIKCSLKASEGVLFLLEKSFFFIHKPATFIRYADVATVEFQRCAVGGQARGMMTFFHI